MLEHPIHLGTLLGTYWPVAAISFAVSLVMTPICRSFALARGITDKPDKFLKPHQKPIPYLGGVAIFTGWAAGLVLAWFMFGTSRSLNTTPLTEPKLMHTATLGILLAGFGTMLIGLFDDLRVMTPRTKLLANLMVAAVLLGSGLGDDIIRVVTELARIEISPWLMLAYSIPITVFIVVGSCNATNLIDGMDGLCSGVLGIISLGFLVIALHMHIYAGWTPYNTERVVLCLAMAGASLGFLPYNRNPATIFMGDAGSMLLGLNAAVLILLFTEGVFLLRWGLASLTVFGLPLADMMLAMARRWRAQKPVMQGDRSHFYDQLHDRGFPVRKVVLICYAVAAFYALVGCASIVIQTRYSLLVYGSVCLLTITAMVRFGFLRVENTVNPAKKV